MSSTMHLPEHIIYYYYTPVVLMVSLWACYREGPAKDETLITTYNYFGLAITSFNSNICLYVLFLNDTLDDFTKDKESRL